MIYRKDNCVFQGPYPSSLDQPVSETAWEDDDENPYQEVLADSDEEIDEEIVKFVAQQVPLLKKIPEKKEATPENERLRASNTLPRKVFLQLRDQELTALLSFFGEDKFFSFQKELIPHFYKKVPFRERGLFDLSVEPYTFLNMYGIKSISEMICCVVLPELMTQFLMKNEGINRNTAVSRIFRTHGGKTLYHPYMLDAKNEKETNPTSNKCRRKSTIPRKVIRK